MGRLDCTITPMCRAWGGFALDAALLASAPTDVTSQVFVAASPRPDFTIGPVFVGATAPADHAAPDNVSVTWHLAPLRGERPSPQMLPLVWPAAIASATAPGAEPHAPRARPDHAEARDVARGRLLGPAQRALGVLGRPRLGRVLPALSRASREHRPPRARVLAAARELPRRRPPAHRGDRAGRRHAAWQPAARRHRDRHAAAQHGGPGAAGAQGG